MTNPEGYLVNTERMALQHGFTRYLSDITLGMLVSQRPLWLSSSPTPLSLVAQIYRGWNFTFYWLHFVFVNYYKLSYCFSDLRELIFHYLYK